MTKFFILFSIFFSSQLLADDIGLFSGRVSKVNQEAGLVRFKIDFENVRFLNKNNQLSFWLEGRKESVCESTLIGKTNEYLLVKIDHFKFCNSKVPFTTGSYVRIYSEDLNSNIMIARSLVDILLKKRLAIRSKLDRVTKDVKSFEEKFSALRRRYEVLKEKLEIEMKIELTKLENDRAVLTRNRAALEIRLGEIDHKLEEYKIEDKNLKTDRWSLDPKQYTQK